MNEHLNPRSIFLGQIQLLEQQINQVEDKLQAGAAVDPALYQRIHIPFADQIDQQRRDLNDLRGRVYSSPQFYALFWDDLHTLHEQCNRLFQESLAFLEGALARKARLDDGLCRIADILLSELAHNTDITWERFTILAGGEFINELAQIIRIRFPEMGIWNLPVAAHEFGHYVGPRLELPGGQRPFYDLLQQEKSRAGQGLQHWSSWHEYFADLYATYTLGPAFAAACLLLRFDPRTAYAERDLHPTDAQRAYVILRGLELLDSARQSVELARAREFLEDAWRRNLTGAGQKDKLAQDESTALDKKVAKIHGWLAARTGARLSNQSMQRAASLASEIKHQLAAGLSFKASTAADLTLVELLNGAWYWRLFHWQGDPISLGRVSEALAALGSKKIAAGSF